MTPLTIILGASDPEMQAIEDLGRQVGAEIRYALSARGVRVRADEAYQAVAITDRLHLDRRSLNAPLPPDSMVYAVECDGPAIPADAIRIDHHRPGDPGYGLPPAEFLSASSIGQVIRALARLGAIPSSWRHMSAGWAAPLTPQYAADGAPVDYTGVSWLRVGRGGKDAWDIVLDAHTFARVPRELVLAAAADHCLAAAYRGECPGVEPDALMRWRVESRAAFQRRPPAEILADIARARQVLRQAPEIVLARHIVARDMRGQHVPELPEAAAREGLCVVADLPGPDGRVKVVCQSGSPEQIDAFLHVWGPAQGLTDVYGDPARGFAGGYH